MKDELDLTQFKDLVGEVGSDKSTFSVEDILKENFNQPEPIEHKEPDEIVKTSELEFEPEQQTEEYADDLQAQPQSDTEAEIQQDTQPKEDVQAPPEEDEIQTEQPKQKNTAKKHFWDDWVIPEEPETEQQDDEAPEQKTEAAPEEPGFLDRMFGIVYDDELDSVQNDIKKENFEEKKPQRHFWEKWLTPKPIEEDEVLESADMPNDNELSDETELLDETAVSDETELLDETELPDEKKIESDETQLLDDDNKDSEEPEDRTDDSANADIQPEENIEPADEDEKIPEETEIIECAVSDDGEDQDEQSAEDTERLEIDCEEISETEDSDLHDDDSISDAKIKKPEFFSKWFTPIDEDTKSEENKDSEQKQSQSVSDNAQDYANEERDDTLQLPKIEESEPPVISEQEFEAFMKENDKEPEHISFEELVNQNQAKADNIQHPTVEKGEIVRREEEKLETQMVYVDLSRKKSESKPPEAKETEKIEPHISKYKAREIPKPKWIDMSIEEISRIAPKTVRINNEPVLMSEVRRLEQERMKSEAAANTVRNDVKIPENPQQSDKTQTEEGEDESSSGG